MDLILYYWLLLIMCCAFLAVCFVTARQNTEKLPRKHAAVYMFRYEPQTALLTFLQIKAGMCSEGILLPQ
jgi:hypothetical protein